MDYKLIQVKIRNVYQSLKIKHWLYNIYTKNTGNVGWKYNFVFVAIETYEWVL